MDSQSTPDFGCRLSGVRVGAPKEEKTLPIKQNTIPNDSLKLAKKAYYEATLRIAQRNIHVYIAVASVVTFLFLIFDLIQIQGQMARLTIAIVRYAFSIFLIIMTRALQNARSFTAFSVMVSALEVAAIVLYLYALWLYESPNFMIQSMGLIWSILIFFVVPNRKWNMLALSVFDSAAYFIFSFFCYDKLSPDEFLAAIIYAVLMILICTIAVFMREKTAFQEFVTKARLEQASSTDFLTNAATRARLEDEAQRWMSFCRRQGLPLCLVFADVDNLKYINDHFGHAAGDIVLKQLADQMKKQLRSSDTIARWGGDEFVILLPNVSLKNAMLLLDRVKQAVSQIDLHSGVTISCSYGVVEMGSESTYQQLLSEADARMYRAKRAGKEQNTATRTTIGD